MNREDMYVAMYRCLAVLHQEEPDEKLGEFLLSINPYVLNEENAADPKQRKKFDKCIKIKASSDDISEQEAYGLVAEYLETETEFGDVFAKLPLSDWMSLCYIINQEKTATVMNVLRDRADEMLEGNPSDADIEALFNDPAFIMKGMGAMGGSSGMGAMNGFGGNPYSGTPAKKKTVHPSKKKKKKKK